MLDSEPPRLPQGRAQWRARRKTVWKGNKPTGPQQRHPTPQAAALAETDTQGQCSRQVLPHPWQDRAHSRLPFSYGGVEQPANLFGTETLVCFPQRPAARCAGTHTGPTHLVPSSHCTKCFLLALWPGLTGRGETQHFLWAELVFRYKQNQSCSTILLSSHQAEYSTSPDKSLLGTGKVGNLHGWNATKHSVIVEVTIAHLRRPFFSPLSKQSHAQRHLYS